MRQSDRMQQIIVFSDLDGTLLDSTNYSFADALPALQMMQEHGIPLILCSSKTRAEIEVYRSRLDNVHPFISENGGGIFIPRGYFAAPVTERETDGYEVITLGESYVKIRQRFVQLREQTQARVSGFADMSIEDVCTLTGLAWDEAMLAKQRDFDEPFVFEGADDPRFLQAIEASGLHWTQGRIFHILGCHDKGRAVNMLISYYRRQHENVVSVGLGDGLNDLQLLLAVDRPVLVRHKDGNFDARVVVPGLSKTDAPGPAGWNAAVLALLTACQLTPDAPGKDHGEP